MLSEAGSVGTNNLTYKQRILCGLRGVREGGEGDDAKMGIKQSKGGQEQKNGMLGMDESWEILVKVG